MDSEEFFIVVVGDVRDQLINSTDLTSINSEALQLLMRDNIKKESNPIETEPEAHYRDIEIKQECLEVKAEVDDTEVKEEILTSDVSAVEDKLCSGKIKSLEKHILCQHSHQKELVKKPTALDKNLLHECPICFVKVKQLRRHIQRQHVNEGKSRKAECYSCHLCSAIYKSDKALEAHINAHLGRRPFKCPDCPQAYTRMSALRTHRTKHSDVEYICDHCKKVTKRKDALIEHMKGHSTTKYKCKICERTYALLSSLKKHIQSKHIDPPNANKCHICQKTYARFYVLREHMLRKHNYNLMSKKIYYNMLPKMDLPSTDILAVEK